MNDAADDWPILIRPQPGPVPAAVRIKRWLKLGLRAFGLVCSSLDLPLELRQLRARVALLEAENEHLQEIVGSLAARVAAQHDLLAKRAERRDSA